MSSAAFDDYGMPVSQSQKQFQNQPQQGQQYYDDYAGSGFDSNGGPFPNTAGRRDPFASAQGASPNNSKFRSNSLAGGNFAHNVFKGKKNKGKMTDFDIDDGDGDGEEKDVALPSSAAAKNMLFQDISHIRDRGRYGGFDTMDTAPIIPTLETPFDVPGAAKGNNTQYRKAMTLQKKHMMSNIAKMNSQYQHNHNLLNPIGGGSNDQMNMGNGADLRNNSFGGAMNTGMNPSGPRSMSLATGSAQRFPNRPYKPAGGMPPMNSNGMRSNQGGPPMGNGIPGQGPRSMSFTNNPTMRNQMGKIPAMGQDPRAMSLQSGRLPPFAPKPVNPMMDPMNGGGSRNGSLGNMQNPMNAGRNGSLGNMQNPMNAGRNGSLGNMQNPMNAGRNGSLGNMQNPMNAGRNGSLGNMQNPMNSGRNGSLTNMQNGMPNKGVPGRIGNIANANSMNGGVPQPNLYGSGPASRNGSLTNMQNPINGFGPGSRNGSLTNMQNPMNQNHQGVQGSNLRNGSMTNTQSPMNPYNQIQQNEKDVPPPPISKSEFDRARTPSPQKKALDNNGSPLKASPVKHSGSPKKYVNNSGSPRKYTGTSSGTPKKPAEPTSNKNYQRSSLSHEILERNNFEIPKSPTIEEEPSGRFSDERNIDKFGGTSGFNLSDTNPYASMDKVKPSSSKSNNSHNDHSKTNDATSKKAFFSSSKDSGTGTFKDNDDDDDLNDVYYNSKAKPKTLPDFDKSPDLDSYNPYGSNAFEPRAEEQKSEKKILRRKPPRNSNSDFAPVDQLRTSTNTHQSNSHKGNNFMAKLEASIDDSIGVIDESGRDFDEKHSVEKRNSSLAVSSYDKISTHSNFSNTSSFDNGNNSNTSQNNNRQSNRNSVGLANGFFKKLGLKKKPSVNSKEAKETKDSKRKSKSSKRDSKTNSFVMVKATSTTEKNRNSLLSASNSPNTSTVSDNGSTSFTQRMLRNSILPDNTSNSEKYTHDIYNLEEEKASLFAPVTKTNLESNINDSKFRLREEPSKASSVPPQESQGHLSVQKSAYNDYERSYEDLNEIITTKPMNDKISTKKDDTAETGFNYNKPKGTKSHEGSASNNGLVSDYRLELPEDSFGDSFGGAFADIDRKFDDVYTSKSSSTSIAITKDQELAAKAEVENEFMKMSIRTEVSDDNKQGKRDLSFGNSKITNNDKVTNKNISSNLQLSDRLNLTVEQMGIIEANQSLINELQLMTKELTDSIQREVKLENDLQNYKINREPLSSTTLDVEKLEKESREKSMTISQLMTELSEERRKRQTAEEHVLLWERDHGIIPSVLELNYAKNQLETEIISKQEMINQQQQLIYQFDNEKSQIQSNSLKTEQENINLKKKVIPDLKNEIEMLKSKEAQTSKKFQDKINELKLENERIRMNLNQFEGQNLAESQRDALREALQSLKEQRDKETRIANEKIAQLKIKVEKLSTLNEKLQEKLLG